MKSGMNKSAELPEHLKDLVKSKSAYLDSLDEYDSEECFDDILYSVTEAISLFQLRRQIGSNPSDKN